MTCLKRQQPKYLPSECLGIMNSLELDELPDQLHGWLITSVICDGHVYVIQKKQYLETQKKLGLKLLFEDI